MRLKNLLPILLLSLIPISLSAEKKTFTSRLEAGMRAGYAFNSNSVLMDRLMEGGTVGHGAMSWHLRYSFLKPESPRTSSVYQGIGVSANTFFQNRYVGSPLGIYVFQGAPFAVLSDRLSLDYEWNFGATFGWKKTTPDCPISSNLVVGSSTNAYINLGLKFSYAVSDAVSLTAGLDLSHYSNGNTSWPNPGVNTMGGAIGVVYTPGTKMSRPVSPFSNESDFEKGMSVDLTAFGAWRKAYFPVDQGAFTEQGEAALLPGHFGVAGITAAPMWDLHSTFRTGVSADIQWGENTALAKYHISGTYGENAKFTRPPFLRQVSLGLSARAELVMPIFSVNVGIGYGIAGPPETRKLYQVVTLKTYIAGPVYLNVGYRMVEFHSPSNLMLGVGVTLGRHK